MKKKDKIKSLQLQVDCLTALLAEYVVKEALRRIPIPNYAKGCKDDLAIVNNGADKEVVLNKSKFKRKLDEVMEQQKQAK